LTPGWYRVRIPRSRAGSVDKRICCDLRPLHRWLLWRGGWVRLSDRQRCHRWLVGAAADETAGCRAGWISAAVPRWRRCLQYPGAAVATEACWTVGPRWPPRLLMETGFDDWLVGKVDARLQALGLALLHLRCRLEGSAARLSGGSADQRCQ
uniref:Unclassified n=1 Tax=Macrostomum lignano TaxID=282301 RepID=A0A1I8FP56_9PLAT